MGNYKKFLIVVLVGVFAAAGTVKYRNNKMNFNLTHICGVKICNEAEISSLIDGKEFREDSDDIADLIQCDGIPVPYVAEENCFYLNQNSSHDVSDGTITCSAGYEACILKDYYEGKRAEAIIHRNHFSLFLISPTEYRKCSLILSGIPVISISSKDEITQKYAQGDFLLCDCTKALSSKGNVFEEPITGKININDSREVYTLKLLREERDFLGMGKHVSWQLNLISDVDDTFCRQMMAAEIWNRICEDSSLQRPYRYVELIVNNSYLGLCLLTPKIDSEFFGFAEEKNVQNENDFDTRQELLQSVTQESLARYFLFLQATYAYENLNDSYYVVNGKHLMPGRVEYSFNTFPSKHLWRSYQGERRLLTSEEFGVDEETLADVGTIWKEVRCSVLSDESIETIISNMRTYLYNNGFIDRDINHASSFAENYDVLREYIAKRFALLDALYTGENLPEPKPEANTASEEPKGTENTEETEEASYGETLDFVRLSVTGEDSTQEIKLYLKNGEAAYFFLPSFATEENTAWIIDSSEHEITHTETEITIDSVTYPLEYMYSENIAAMFIETANGTLDYIDSERHNSEPGDMVCITQDGKSDSFGKIDKLKSRGFTSFSDEKGSYLMKMTEPTDVLHMGSAKKWVLQANLYDATLLRNKITYDMAKELGLRFAIDSEYVDLYCNGEYSGNYLVCEKVEVGENRINITDTEGSYLLIYDRYEDEEPTFFDAFNWEVGFKYPKTLKEDKISAVSESFSAIEHRIEECDSYADYQELEQLIDIQSFAIMYIINSVTNEVDSNYVSTFYYFDGNDRKLYAGPAWDYDRAYGNEVSGIGNYAEVDAYLHGLPEKMMNIPYFRSDVKELYEKNYREYLFGFSENELNQRADAIRKSGAMNHVLYNTVDQGFIDTGFAEANILYLKDHYSRRLELLDGSLNGEYHILLIDNSLRAGRAVWVKDGETVPKSIIDYLCTKNQCERLTFENGSGFWDGYKVHSDLILYCR